MKYRIDKVGPVIMVSIDDAPEIVVTKDELERHVTPLTRGQEDEVLHKLECDKKLRKDGAA